MFKGQYVFLQITDHLPLHTFRRCVERYLGERYVKYFKFYDQYLAMSFAQLTHRESLRDIEACLQRFKAANSIILVFDHLFPEVHLQMQTSSETGEFMQTLLKH